MKYLVQDLGLPSAITVESCPLDEKYEQLVQSCGSSIPELGLHAVRKRRIEFYSGRWCAGRAIGALTGKFSVPGRNEDRSPAWPQGVVGSISHSTEWAIAIAGDAKSCRRIGVDLEAIQHDLVVDELRASILSQKEWSLVMGCTDKTKAFLTVFSCKESLFKALYPEVGSYFDYLDATVIALAHDAVTLRVNKPLGKASLFDQALFNVHVRYVANHVLTWHVDLL